MLFESGNIEISNIEITDKLPESNHSCHAGFMMELREGNKELIEALNTLLKVCLEQATNPEKSNYENKMNFISIVAQMAALLINKTFETITIYENNPQNSNTVPDR